MKANLNKKVVIIGNISKGHQWGNVHYRGGCYSTEMANQYKYPLAVVRKWKKDLKD